MFYNGHKIPVVFFKRALVKHYVHTVENIAIKKVSVCIHFFVIY